MQKVELISSNRNKRMGIDIYAEWEGMTEQDRQAQSTGFSVEDGDVG